MPRARPSRLYTFAAVYVVAGLGCWYLLCSLGAFPDDSMLAPPMRRRLQMDDADDGETKEGWPDGQEYMAVFNFLGCVYMFIALGIIVDEFFVPALESIADQWGLTPDIAGATLMAAGGSAPELFTSLIGTFKRSDVGFGTIVGSAVFNVLFVIGAVAICSPDELKLTWWPLFRDCVYYTFSLSVLATFFSCFPDSCSGPPLMNVTTLDKVKKENVTVEQPGPLKITLWEGIILLVMYFGYVFFMAHNQAVRIWVIRVILRNPEGAKQLLEEGKEPESSVTNPVARQDSEDAAVAEQTSNGVMVIAKNNTYTDGDNRLHRAPSIAEKKLARASISLSHTKASNFRAGMLRILLSDKAIVDRVGFTAVKQTAGDVNATFQHIDTKNQGFIDKAELEVFLQKKANVKPSKDELDQVFNSLDQDRDGKVSKGEFQKWYASADQRLRMEIVEKFQVYDKNNDNKIDQKELGPLLVDLGVQKADENVIAGFVAELDTNKDGAIQEDEFVRWYLKQPFDSSGNFQEDEEHEPMNPWETPESYRGFIFWIICLPLMLSMYYTLPDVQVKGKEKWKFYTFFASICWIGFYSFFMVEWATQLGSTLGIPPAVMGLTFLAAGTSVPDLLSSVVVALKGEGDMAVSSSIGSNIFDVLVGLPLPWICFNLIMGENVEVKAESLGLSIIILIFMLVCVVTLVMCSGWKITKTLGYSMFLLYGLFVMQDLMRTYKVGPFKNF